MNEQNGAVISPCGKYRYHLWRTISEGSRTVVFVMLNPSIADATVQDPTIRKCIGFAKRWGFNRIEVVNLFAYRATDPDELLTVNNPIGPENDQWISDALAAKWRPRALINDPDYKIVFAWGGINKKLELRARKVKFFADGAGLLYYCLGRTKGGQPRHPLMLPYKTELEPYVDAQVPGKAIMVTF